MYKNGPWGAVSRPGTVKQLERMDVHKSIFLGGWFIQVELRALISLVDRWLNLPAQYRCALRWILAGRR